MAGKSLGTLTLDLVAKIGGFVDGMSKAERATNKWEAKVKTSSIAVGTAIGNMAADAIKKFASLAGAQLKAGEEIVRLSTVANTGASDFQKITYASKQFGVEQEKVADILKDVNDKVGDFLTTGAGPMADFFETVAPLVGVTADNFRDLSGKDALQLYVSSLEKANLSQAEMTFFMEAIASDATLLLPLLRDNGKELGRFGDQAEKLGVVLSDIEVQKLNEVARQTHILEGALGGLANQVTIALLPTMQDLADLLQDPDTIEGLAALAKGFGDVAKFVVEAATGLANFSKWAGEEISVTINGLDPADSVRMQEAIGDLETRLENLRVQLEKSDDEDFDFVENLLGAPERIRADLKEQISVVEKELGDLYKKRDSFNSALEGIKAGAGTTATNPTTPPVPPKSIAGPTKEQRDAQKALNEEYQKTLENYERQAELVAATTEREQILYEIQKGRLVGINDEQKKRLVALAEEIDAQERLKKAVAEYADVQKYLGQEKSGNPEIDRLNEQYDDRLEIIKEALAAEAITKQEHDAAMLELDRQTADERKRILEETQAVAQATAINNMANILSITGSQVQQLQSLYGEASGVGKAFYVVSQALAAANAIVHGIQSGMAIRAAYAQMAAMAGPAAPGILATGEAHAQVAQALGFASAGIITAQTIAGFMGGGYTGNGARGEIAGVVHGREFVFDAESTRRIGVDRLEQIRSGKNATGGNSVSIKIDGVKDSGDLKRTANQIARKTSRAIRQAG